MAFLTTLSELHYFFSKLYQYNTKILKLRINGERKKKTWVLNESVVRTVLLNCVMGAACQSSHTEMGDMSEGCCPQSRAYQFGLSLGDLAVILLQDFFQLLPLRFFFLLNGQYSAMLAHEEATATEHFMYICTHTHAHTHTTSRRTHTNSSCHRELCLASRTWPHCGFLLQPDSI